jgi:SHS2 domain-containing protein
MQNAQDTPSAGFKILDHTADIGLELEANTLPDLFAAGAKGLMHIICPHCQIRPAETHSLQVCGETAEELLVNWLSELNYLCQVQRFLTADVQIDEIQVRALSAKVIGEQIDPLRHALHSEIKAVTYHRIEVRQTASGLWQGRVYFDI